MPSGPESLISISPICQTAASDALTTPGTSAFAEVLAPQVLPMLNYFVRNTKLNEQELAELKRIVSGKEK